MKLLTLSDVELPVIYSTRIKERFANVDLAISCGDLSCGYLEYIISMLDIPLYFVQGNHAPKQEQDSGEPRDNPWGAVDLHRRVIHNKRFDLILAGIEGSLRYNKAAHQYTQTEMWWFVLSLVPQLLINKIRYGRFLDVFVTHAAPWGIHDDTDKAHQGIKAFLWLIKVFQPSYHLHGHIHLYLPKIPYETRMGKTTIINTYGFRELTFSPLSSTSKI